MSSTGETKSNGQPSDARFELLEMIDSVKQKLTDNEYKLMVEKLQELPNKKSNLEEYECTVLAPRCKNIGTTRKPHWHRDIFTYKCRVWLSPIERRIMCYTSNTIVSRHSLEINATGTRILFHIIPNNHIAVDSSGTDRATNARLFNLFKPAVEGIFHSNNTRYNISVQVLDIRRVEQIQQAFYTLSDLSDDSSSDEE